MSTPEDKIARSLRNDLEARIGAWKAEREQLLKAQERIVELDALIAFAEDESRQTFKVASRDQVRSVADIDDETIGKERT